MDFVSVIYFNTRLISDNYARLASKTNGKTEVNVFTTVTGGVQHKDVCCQKKVFYYKQIGYY